MRGILVIIFTLLELIVSQHSSGPYFLEQCPRNEDIVNSCLKSSGNRFIKHLRDGIPELDIIEVEPVLIDEISISLGNGPDGYRAIFRNIEAYGVSNLTIAHIRSDIDTLQFQLTCDIPKIRVKAQYRSTGVLILVRASGAGDYWGNYEGVKAKIYFRATSHSKPNGYTYLSVEEVKMDFSVKEISMGVENIANGNSIIQAALNLFINSNSQELLKEMKPALRSKLTEVTKKFLDRLFGRIPLEHWID